MTSRLRRRGLRLPAVALAAALALSGCSGEASDPEAGATSDGTSPQVAEEPYLEVPDGVELTAQGSELELGEKATVAYEPRQDQVGALEITVTSMEKASFRLFEGWKLSPETKAKAPYFVRAKVTNVGDTDLGGRPVPLYGVDGANLLLEASEFRSSFKPCSGYAFPEKFKTGDSMKSCLVYLAPDKGDLVGVSFRPDEDFNPIVWSGELTAVGSGDQEKKSDGKKSEGKKSDEKKPGDKQDKGDQQD